MGSRSKQRGYGCAIITTAAWARCRFEVSFAIGDGVTLCFRSKAPLLTQRFNRSISVTLSLIESVVYYVSRLTALALLVGSYQRRKPLGSRTTLESLAADGSHVFRLLLDEVFRLLEYAAEEIGLSGGKWIYLILRKVAAARWCNASNASNETQVNALKRRA